MGTHADIARPLPPPSSNRVVFGQISKFASLGLLEAFSFGVIVPMIPIVTTEVPKICASYGYLRCA